MTKSRLQDKNIKLKMVSTRNGMLPYSVIVAASETVCTPITNTVAMTLQIIDVDLPAAF